jgi:excisionase family DNA binding protein
MDSKFMTIKEVAELLKVNKMTLYRAIKKGKIKAVKIGKDFRITDTEFENFIKRNSTNGK